MNIQFISAELDLDLGDDLDLMGLDDEMDLGGLTPGVYLLEVRFGDSQREIVKLMR